MTGIELYAHAAIIRYAYSSRVIFHRATLCRRSARNAFTRRATRGKSSRTMCAREKKKKRGERSGSVMLILTTADKMLSDEL